jgi:ABC-type sugar transport system ATPase subunit
MSSLKLNNVRKRFGNIETIHGISLTIDEGEFVVFVGPSGCGKSTLLRMVAGLDEVSEGTITIGGADVTDAAPSARNVAMVFQSYALYPHMTVLENLTFGLRMKKVARAVIDAKVARAVAMLQLEPYLQRKPAALSGGQAQRVAIGRALVQEPAIFLFDEPLSNLDAELRLKMRVEIGALHQTLQKTMIYVTHDQVEAMTLADKIVVLRDGVIEQSGKPLDLYRNPVNQFVAGFIGSPAMNMLAGELVAPDTFSLTAGTQVTVAAHDGGTGRATLGIRPEHLQIEAAGVLQGQVKVVERLGATAFVYVNVADTGATIAIEASGEVAVHAGETIRFSPKPEWLYLFDEHGRTISRPK